MTEDDKINKILELLLEKTRRGEIEWKETLPAESFITSFPSYSVKISLDRKNSNPVLVVYNDKGGIISEASSASSLADMAGGAGRGLAARRVSQLYELVRGRKKDSELDKLLEELQQAS
jgi:hypothetical protein